MKALTQQGSVGDLRIRGVPVQRFLQFCVIGTSGLLVDNAVLFVLVDGIGWPVIGSKVIAAVTAMVTNFFWNFGVNYLVSWKGPGG